MKKVYIAPRVEVNEISAELMICESQKLYSTDTSNPNFVNQGKDRGDYEPEDDASFGDLW
ncbi:MAG: hypothetical protein IJV06_01035 [Bacteroidaceae bacterium]|nr:hypothetical protein [Bacteroidaceae bacterium]